MLTKYKYLRQEVGLVNGIRGEEYAEETPAPAPPHYVP